VDIGFGFWRGDGWAGGGKRIGGTRGGGPPGRRVPPVRPPPGGPPEGGVPRITNPDWLHVDFEKGIGHGAPDPPHGNAEKTPHRRPLSGLRSPVVYRFGGTEGSVGGDRHSALGIQPIGAPGAPPFKRPQSPFKKKNCGNRTCGAKIAKFPSTGKRSASNFPPVQDRSRKPGGAGDQGGPSKSGGHPPGQHEKRGIGPK